MGVPGNDGGPRNTEDVKRAIANLPPKARKNVLTGALNTLLDDTGAERSAAPAAARTPPPDTAEAGRGVTPEALRTLSTEAKKDVANEAMVSLPTEAKKDVAAEAVRALPTQAKKDVAADLLRNLPVEDQKDLAEDIRPTQPVVDRVWQIIVWAFSAVFVSSALAFIAAVLLGAPDIELLLTLVTTVTGILAGFVSGRASSGGSGRPGSGGPPA